MKVFNTAYDLTKDHSSGKLNLQLFISNLKYVYGHVSNLLFNDIHRSYF